MEATIYRCPLTNKCSRISVNLSRKYLCRPFSKTTNEDTTPSSNIYLKISHIFGTNIVLNDTNSMKQEVFVLLWPIPIHKAAFKSSLITENDIPAKFWHFLFNNLWFSDVSMEMKRKHCRNGWPFNE